MYLDYFGLKEAPFRITPNTEYWYAGGQRGEILTALNYAIGQGEGIIKVVGEVGSGKTMLCRMLAAKLPDSIDCVFLGNPTLAPDDMLAAILMELGVGLPDPTRQGRLTQLNQVLLARHDTQRRVVVFVEEAQAVPLDSLEFLRLLTNLETATDKLLQIVLFGQPELDVLLADPRIRQLKDRITLNLNLSPLNEREVGDYVRARLAVAGYRGPDMFGPSLIARLTQLSNGLSRRINVLADKTLLAAYAEQTHNLELRHLEAAAHDAETAASKRPTPIRPAWGWMASGLVAGTALLGFISWQASGWGARPVPARALIAQTNLPQRAPTPTVLPDATAAAQDTARWLQQAPAGTFVIQLAAAKDAASVAVLLQRFHSSALPAPLRVLHGMRRGEAAWMLIAGEYADRETATAALRKLTAPGPETPFLRTVAKMRTVVLPSGSL